MGGEHHEMRCRCADCRHRKGEMNLAYWRCRTCEYITGKPESHAPGHVPDWERCTCGSGGHPRQCELHPNAYERHVAELNEIEE